VSVAQTDSTVWLSGFAQRREEMRLPHFTGIGIANTYQSPIKKMSSQRNQFVFLCVCQDRDTVDLVLAHGYVEPNRPRLLEHQSVHGEELMLTKILCLAVRRNPLSLVRLHTHSTHPVIRD